MNAIALDRPGRRWSGSLGIVLALHALIVAAVLWRGMRLPPAAPPMAPPTTVMVELAPLASAPPAAPTELPPGPPQQAQRKAQAESEPTPLPEPPPTPAEPTELALPSLPAPRQQVQDPGEADIADTRAPPQVAAPADTRYAASETVVGSGQARADWDAQLLGRLERFKRYPRVAERRRQQGVAQVRFTLDRQGRVLAVVLADSSGHPALDAEAIATVERASPLPAPPAEIVGDPLEVTTPVQFHLR